MSCDVTSGDRQVTMAVGGTKLQAALRSAPEKPAEKPVENKGEATPLHTAPGTVPAAWAEPQFVEGVTEASLRASTTYVLRHCSPAARTALWGFQEMLRIHEARRWSRDPERAARGWTALDALETATLAWTACDRSHLGADTPSTLSAEFVSAVKATCADVARRGGEAKCPDVQREVMALWMYPATEEPTWIPLESDKGVVALRIAADLLASSPGIGPKLVDGGIRLALGDFCSTFWARCGAVGASIACLVPGLARPLTEFKESAYMALVDSAVVWRLCAFQAAELEAFLYSWSTRPFPIKPTQLLHTIRLNRAYIGVCLALAVEVAGPIAEFMRDFDARFNGGSPAVELVANGIIVAVDLRAPP